MANIGLFWNKRGQAGIMDGLILLIITSICSVALLSIAGSYGRDALLQYDVIYKQKVVQSALLSLYHVTDGEKSVMAYVSQDIAAGETALPNSKSKIERILLYYNSKIGWDFGFALLDEPAKMPAPETYVNTGGLAFERFIDYPKVCANAALTYPTNKEGGMGYQLFQVCVWSRD